MIIEIQRSPVKNKRFRIVMDDGKHYDFGYLHGSTYIDHHDKAKRLAYLKRHMANETEAKLIDNLVPSPALFAALILWGPYKTLLRNIMNLNNLWRRKHSH